MTTRRQPRLRPRVVCTWGVALTIGGGALAVFLPEVTYRLSTAAARASGVDVALLGLLEVIAQLLGRTLPTLGIVFIGAAITMTYLWHLLHPAGAADVSTAATTSTD